MLFGTMTVARVMGAVLLPAPCVALMAWEQIWWMRRRQIRADLYARAQQRAEALGRPLVVIGDPKGGVTHDDYGCGDLSIDLTGCPECLGPDGLPNGVAADLCEPGSIPAENDSTVVFVACVLEYVPDFDAACEEILRVAGSPENVFVVRVEPWTMVGLMYPGGRRLLSEDGLSVLMEFPRRT
jgi:hypothetical protein